MWPSYEAEVSYHAVDNFFIPLSRGVNTIYGQPKQLLWKIFHYGRSVHADIYQVPIHDEGKVAAVAFSGLLED